MYFTDKFNNKPERNKDINIKSIDEHNYLLKITLKKLKMK